MAGDLRKGLEERRVGLGWRNIWNTDRSRKVPGGREVKLWTRRREQVRSACQRFTQNTVWSPGAGGQLTATAAQAEAGAARRPEVLLREEGQWGRSRRTGSATQLWAPHPQAPSSQATWRWWVVFHGEGLRSSQGISTWTQASTSSVRAGSSLPAPPPTKGTVAEAPGRWRHRLTTSDSSQAGRLSREPRWPVLQCVGGVASSPGGTSANRGHPGIRAHLCFNSHVENL